MPVVRKVAFAASVGNAIELYDFLIYGTAAAVVFNKLFFPNSDPRVGTLLAFATYGAGFFARPVGAMVIGHFGDRIGRRPMLVLTLTVSGLCTAAIGALPTYHAAGVLAPLLLVALRVVQGFFLGGEQSGAALITVEHSPPERRGWYGSWTFLGSPLGLVLGTGMFSLAGTISGPSFLDWGWRVPFLASLLLVAVGIYVRLGVEESPEFRAVAGRRVRHPVIEVLRDDWKRVLAGAGVNLGFNMFIFVLAAFMLSYGTDELHLPRSLLLDASVLGGLAQAIGLLVFGRLTDRVGRLPVMLAGGVFMAVFAFPLFALVGTRNPALVVIALIVAYAGCGAIFGPMAVYYAELFGTRVRFSGAALSYQLGAVLGGGISPAVATALLGASGGAYWPVALYLVGGAVVSVLCLLFLGETAPARRGAEVPMAAGTPWLSRPATRWPGAQ
jgi:MFS transporter, MHS family, shikimate and dehydroshikimate transport protein